MDSYGTVSVFIIVFMALFIFYIIFIEYPEGIKAKKSLDDMDCKTLKDHLLKEDLHYVSNEDIQSKVIGKCLQ